MLEAPAPLPSAPPPTAAASPAAASPAAASPAAASPAAASPAGRAEQHVSFHDVLSALNPLQYLPVIGTIYRALTGDQIPEAIRRAGSLVVSAALGGPIGVMCNLVSLAAEKITGIDLDRTGQALLDGHAAPATAVATASEPAAGRAETPATAGAVTQTAAQPGQVLPNASPLPSHADAVGAAMQPATTSRPWSTAQLAAYGVATGDDGALHLHDLSGADVLNSLELGRLRGASAAYQRVASLVP